MAYGVEHAYDFSQDEPPSGAENGEAFGMAIVAVLRRDHAFDTDEALEVLNAAEVLLASRPESDIFAGHTPATSETIKASAILGEALDARPAESAKTVPEYESDEWYNLHDAYAHGWCDGHKSGHVEFDWIDEGFVDYLKDRAQGEGR